MVKGTWVGGKIVLKAYGYIGNYEELVELKELTITAKRVLKERGEYDPKDTGSKSDFNRLKKYFDTHFE